MTPYPDPLFREGLEHYRKPVPASAWERIESGLDKKKHRSPWLKIAAGLFLLLATSILFWKYSETFTSETEVAVGSEQSAAVAELSDEDERKQVEALAVGNRQSAVGSMQSESIVERTCAERSRSSRNNHPVIVLENLPVVERSRNEPSRSSRQSAVGNGQLVVGSQQYSVISQQSIEKSYEASPDELNNKATIPTQEPLLEKTLDVASSESTPDSRSTTISYSADMVNERFIKKECVAEATPEKKNASGLQKVIEKAIDLKNDESLIGDLREKKNEWLTINYPAKKRETNK